MTDDLPTQTITVEVPVKRYTCAVCSATLDVPQFRDPLMRRQQREDNPLQGWYLNIDGNDFDTKACLATWAQGDN